MSNPGTYSNEPLPMATMQVGVLKSSQGLAFVFVICFLATFFSGIISMLMSVYLPVAVKDLLGDVSEEKMNQVSAWINSLFIFGWMIGGIVWGILGDKIGRSRSVVLSIAWFGLFAIGTALSSSWLLVTVCRFLSGFGIGGVLVTTVILISELWSDRKKAIIQGMVSLAMPVGFFAAGAVNNFAGQWRTAFWIGVIPMLLAAIASFVLPESSKWKKFKQEAGQIHNEKTKLFGKMYRKNLLVGSVIFGTMLIGLWAVFSWAPTWVQSISSSPEVQQQRGTAMMILAGGGIAGSFFSGWIVNAIGLRRTMLTCFTACFLLTFILFRLNKDITIISFIEMGMLSFFFGISQGALAVFIPELFPTPIRAFATGFCFNAGRLVTGTVVFFIGALVTWLGGYGSAVFTFSFVFVIGFFATLFSRGTKSI